MFIHAGKGCLEDKGEAFMPKVGFNRAILMKGFHDGIGNGFPDLLGVVSRGGEDGEGKGIARLLDGFETLGIIFGGIHGGEGLGVRKGS